MNKLEDSWGSGGAFPALQNLFLGYNAFYKGLPDAWGRNGSFPSLQVLDLEANFLTGTLPTPLADYNECIQWTLPLQG